MKRKLLPMLALFVSLSLTACGGGNGGGKSTKTSKHVHTAAENAEWQSDDNNHWKDCVANDGGKVNNAKHSFGDPYEITPSTCKVAGTQKVRCTVCNKEVVQTLPLAEHTYPNNGEYTVTAPASCTAAGSKHRVCSVCGYDDVQEIAKLDHQYGDWAPVGEAKCGEQPQESRECSLCHASETRKSSMIPHDWVVQSSVDAGDGGIAYDFVKCSKCNKEGLMVKVKKADGTMNMTVTGTPKTSPEGTVKLGAADDSMTAVIKLAEAKSGKLYFRGSMDYWYTTNNQNEQKGIYDGKGTANKANGIANFKMEVAQGEGALTEVALTADKDLLYKDFLQPEVGYEGVADTNWSKIGDIEVGNVELAAGLNTLKFTRIDSYNTAVESFLVVFTTAA